MEFHIRDVLTLISGQIPQEEEGNGVRRLLKHMTQGIGDMDSELTISECANCLKKRNPELISKAVDFSKGIINLSGEKMISIVPLPAESMQRIRRSSQAFKAGRS